MAEYQRFSLENFIPRNPDGTELNMFHAKFRNIRTEVVEQGRIIVDSAYAANLPGIANDFLDDTSLWWTILMFNGLQDPLDDVKVGIELRIPDRTSLIALLEKMNPNPKALRL